MFASLSSSQALDMITKKTQHKVVEWLAGGDALEAETVIALWLAFGIKHGAARTPQDLDEFSCCVELLDAVPELRGHMRRMTKLSPAWKLMVREWGAIEAKYREEVAIPRCPKTAAMIRAAGASLAEAI